MPLSTLRLKPRGVNRKTQGQDGVRFLLSCTTLSFATTCRFIPAHPDYQVGGVPNNGKNVDLVPDGGRIVALMPVETAEGRKAQNQVTFLENYFALARYSDTISPARMVTTEIMWVHYRRYRCSLTAPSSRTPAIR